MSVVRRLFVVGLLSAAAVVLPGCVANMYPGGPTPTGWLVGNVTSPAQALTCATDASATTSKTGTSSAGAVLGLIGFGDAGVDAAMNAGGITKVHHVDHRVVIILGGLWLSNTTIVHGE